MQLLPIKREIWQRRADGARCRIVTAWYRGRDNAGVVVRWPRGFCARSFYPLAAFLKGFELVEADLFRRSDAAA